MPRERESARRIPAGIGIVGCFTGRCGGGGFPFPAPAAGFFGGGGAMNRRHPVS